MPLKLVIDNGLNTQIVGEFETFDEVNAFLKPIEGDESHELFEAPLKVIDEAGVEYYEFDMYEWEPLNPGMTVILN